MKKVISIFVGLFILMSLMCVVATAQDTGSAYTFETEDAHYTVEFEDNRLSAEQQQTVAEKLVFASGDDSVQKYGLGCTLFGHDYVYTTASVIEHKVRATEPRCKKYMYDVKYCEDCDFTEETLTSTAYIICCD